jgi:hypothetical protein
MVIKILPTRFVVKALTVSTSIYNQMKTRQFMAIALHINRFRIKMHVKTAATQKNYEP